MGGLFSRHGRHHGGKSPKKPVQITDHDRAVLDLKVAKDRLKRYQMKMHSEKMRLTEKAKELVTAGRKDRALLVLKMRRLREDEQAKAAGQLLNVEQLITQIEWEREQLQVFDALKSGNQALEAIHKIVSLEEVDKLMADTADSIAYEQEISRLLSNNLSAGAEEEVLREFDELQALIEAPEHTPVEAAPGAPTVVSADMASKDASEQAEITEATEAGSSLPDLPEVPKHEILTKTNVDVRRDKISKETTSGNARGAGTEEVHVQEKKAKVAVSG
ncbi:snf7 family protein [Nannochloropsis gaditana]|uniref:Snf7 family protein n=1 Tax=Nannochloropsis gaditana TaxID=72520 RepID=W7TN61_9STRA|nr:snf7 family protein [Nannochloropsis gaditana]